ncbi:MAG: 2-oxoglutarate ferredoxin oxidoreductase subunit alpha, partial [Planctomycetota bacterium]|nr:2-oxoglutarate ferredoxin oxidoreductase subunit alpha [Planctomycetota bacterium]
RPWAVPGTPGLEHRLGGLEKEEGSGNVSYDPENHHRMCQLRAEKVERVAETIPDLVVEGPEEGKVLVLGWGSTRGAILSGVSAYYDRGVASAHLLYIHPFPKNLGEVLARYDRVLVPELNFGQLAMVLRAKYLVDVQSLSKLQGKPFKISEIRQAIEDLLQEQN